MPSAQQHTSTTKGSAMLEIAALGIVALVVQRIIHNRRLRRDLEQYK